MDDQGLVYRIFKGFSYLRPVPQVVCTSWDLPLVLWAIQYPPFQPLESVGFRFLTSKVFFLVAVMFACRLGELGLLSCLSPFFRVFEDRLVLRLGIDFCAQSELFVPLSAGSYSSSVLSGPSVP